MHIQPNDVAVRNRLLHERGRCGKLRIALMTEEACFEDRIRPVAPTGAEVIPIERHFFKQRIGALAVDQHQHHVFKSPGSHPACVAVSACGQNVRRSSLGQRIRSGAAGVNRFIGAVRCLFIGEAKAKHSRHVARFVCTQQDAELHVLHVSRCTAAAHGKHISVEVQVIILR